MAIVNDKKFKVKLNNLENFIKIILQMMELTKIN